MSSLAPNLAVSIHPTLRILPSLLTNCLIAEYVDDWGLFDQNQCVIVDENHKLKIINLAKFFREGREHEFKRYHFDNVFDQISNSESNAPTPVIGVPTQPIDLPDSKCEAFEAELDLKKV